MRAVDPSSPQPGSTIHHSIGIGPVLLNDSTEVLDCVPGQELVLLANGRPMGKARITLRLSDLADSGCHIEMAEVPMSPPMSWLPDRVLLAATIPRNRECTWRLAAWQSAAAIPEVTRDPRQRRARGSHSPRLR